METNLFLKILHYINSDICNRNQIANDISISKVILDQIFTYFLENGLLEICIEKKKSNIQLCTHCPFAGKCAIKLPDTYYFLTDKAKNYIKSR